MRRMTVLMLLLALAVLAACSGSDDAADEAASTASDDADTHDAAEPEIAEEADRDDQGSVPPSRDEQAATGGERDGETGDGAAVRPAAVMAGRRVIRTARIELAAEDPDETVDEVYRVAERAGGFVATTDLRRDEEDVLRGTVTLRVPSADLVEVLGDLEGLAVRAPVSRIDEQDVTAEATDLEARLTNLTTYEGELRTLLADVREQTSSPDDLLRIFERIREVRSEIDRIEARLASIEEQVSLATVTVSIEPVATALPVADPTWAPLETVREALTAAARGLGRVADAAIWLVVGILPVLLVVAAPLVVLGLAWRRARRDRSAAPSQPAASSTDPGA